MMGFISIMIQVNLERKDAMVNKRFSKIAENSDYIKEGIDWKTNQ